jgi:hypothetical protein
MKRVTTSDLRPEENIEEPDEQHTVRLRFRFRFGSHTTHCNLYFSPINPGSRTERLLDHWPFDKCRFFGPNKYRIMDSIFTMTA